MINLFKIIPLFVLINSYSFHNNKRAKQHDCQPRIIIDTSLTTCNCDLRHFISLTNLDSAKINAFKKVFRVSRFDMGSNVDKKTANHLFKMLALTNGQPLTVTPDALNDIALRVCQTRKYHLESLKVSQDELITSGVKLEFKFVRENSK